MIELEGVVFPFEDTGEAPLSLLPLAARRALDVVGFRLPLEGYQSLSMDERADLAFAGSVDSVDAGVVERIVKRSTMPAARIKPVADPDPQNPPDQLTAALGSRRAIEPLTWTKLRALDRYTLVHVMRRSIAHDDPSRLEAALLEILPKRDRVTAAPRRDAAPTSRRRDSREDNDLPAASTRSPLSQREALPAALGGFFGNELEGRPASAPPPRPESLWSPPPARDSADHRSAPISDVPPVLGPSRAASNLPAERRPAEGRPERAPADDAPTISTHLTEDGDVHMVDVAHKVPTLRRATATGSVYMRPDTAQRVARNDAPKGEVLATARIAGIMAAKQTPHLIPLCHPIALTSVEVLIDIDTPSGIVNVTVVTEAFDRTGVEMEALTAVSAACLTIYDMLNGIDRDLTISDIRLVQKSGGRTRA